MTIRKNNSQKGVSLIELLVAMTMLSVLMIVVTSSTTFVLTGYRRALITSNAQDEMRFVTEFMSRELRTAKCPVFGDCDMFILDSSGGAAAGNPATPSLFPSLEFTNYKDQVIRYVLVNNSGRGEIRRSNNGGASYQPLTSKRIDIKGVSFIINGDLSITSSLETADQRQPLLTVLITADYTEKNITKTIYFQTSISPRRIQS